jgi:hypothetical protein
MQDLAQIDDIIASSEEPSSSACCAIPVVAVLHIVNQTLATYSSWRAIRRRSQFILCDMG